MTKIMMFIFAVLTTCAFSDQFIFDNQTSYPSKSPKTKIAFQWATSAKQADERNKELLYGNKIDSESMQPISKIGKTKVTIPKNVLYFRVVAWTSQDPSPDHVTNWIDITPGKVYTLNTDQLVPTVLMAGSGC